jgi:hypothetical protein
VGVLLQVHLVRAQEEEERPRGRGELVTDAPSVVARRASMIEQSRRSGFDYTSDSKEPAVTGRPSGIRKLEESVTESGFVIEATDELPLGAWARLEVDRQARRVTATCGGAPTVYCTDGRWRIEEHGVSRGYLLGR